MIKIQFLYDFDYVFDMDDIQFVEYCIGKTGGGYGRFQFISTIALILTGFVNQATFIFFYRYLIEEPVFVVKDDAGTVKVTID